MGLPTPWAIPSAVAFVLLAGINLHVWLRAPRGPLWPALPLVFAGALLFCFGDLGGFLAQDHTARWTAWLVLYLGLITVAPAIFVVTARHAELHGGSAARRALLRAAPVWSVVCGLILVTNPLHGWFVSNVPAEDFARRPLWIPYVVTAYAWVLAAITISIRTSQRARDEAGRREAHVFLLASVLTLSGNFVDVVTASRLPFDPTSLGMCAGAIAALRGVRLGLPNLAAVSGSTLLKTATDGVLLLDAEGRLVARNPAADEWLPAEPREGQPVAPALARAFAQRERADQPLTESGLAADLLSDDQPREGHLFRLRDRDRWVRIASIPLGDGRGGTVRLLRLRDETQLQRLIAAAEDQASMLEAVNSATDEGVLVHVGDEVRFANPQFHEIWRTPPELRDIRTPGELLRAYLPMVAEKERFLDAVERVRNDPLVHIRDEYRLNDGRIQERISLPLIQGGEAVGRVWRVRDVTQQRESEHALLQAQKLESLGLLSGGIAHDFNNLLVSVLGSADLARRELPPEAPAQEYLADVERAAERASELTRQLLAYAGKGRVENEPVHMSEIAREVVELLRVSVPKGVSLRSQLAERLPMVTGDPSQLRQVVMNLLLNAADAVGDAEGEVIVATTVRTLSETEVGDLVGNERFEPGRYVVVSVTDSGVGMSEEVRARIFDPFFTTKFTGRGLGLAAVLGIVRSHRGYLRVESVPGRGSSFWVALPAGSETLAMASAPAPAVGAAGLDATVLVVDDEPHVARVAARMVEAAGGTAIVVGSGKEALERYRAEGAGIDVVLLDLTMPGMSGQDTLVALREVDPTVPVILTSGYPAEEVGGPLGSDPALAFIQKPYRTGRLVETLREVLKS